MKFGWIDFIINVLVILGILSINIWNFADANETDNQGSKVSSIIFNVISALFIIIYTIIRTVRIPDNTLELIEGKGKSIFILLAVSIICLFISTITLTNTESKKDDDKNGDIGKYFKLSLFLFIIIIIAILVLYALIKMGHSLLKWGLIIGVGLLLLVIIGVVIFSYANIGKKEKHEFPFAKYILNYPPPTKRKQSIEQLENILKKLGNFRMDNNCPVDGQTNCEYLFDQYIKSNGDETRLNVILDKLGEMKEKSDEVATGLINQAIYLIYQILQCKIELDYKMSVYKFGSWDWWKTNIYMWGRHLKDGTISTQNGSSLFFRSTDPVQRYIWFIAVLICMIFFFYNIGSYATKIYDFFGKNPLEWGFGIFFFISWTGYLLGAFGNLASSEKEEVDAPVDKELRKYESNYDTSTQTSATSLGKKLLYGFFSVLIASAVVGFFDITYARINAIAMLIALVATFNGYYMILIPQLVIVGLILQKYILSTNIFTNIPATIVKGIILIVVVFASFYDTTYTRGQIKVKPDEKADKVTNVLTSYNEPIWYIFGVLGALLGQNVVESFMDLTDQYGGDRWSLLLMPIVRYIMAFINKGGFDYDVVSVKNTL